MEIALAVVRLYARCAEIACEVEQEIDDGEPVEELLARSNRLLRATRRFLRTGELDLAAEAADDADEAARAGTRAAMLAQHREYQRTKAEWPAARARSRGRQPARPRPRSAVWKRRRRGSAAGDRAARPPRQEVDLLVPPRTLRRLRGR